jgi:hypothetical protein
MLFRFHRETESITLPRKYRPPAARRRKSKRPAPYFVEPVPEDGDVAVSMPEEATPAIARVETTPKAPPKEGPARDVPSSQGKSDTPAATKHIARDYSYVRAEVRRIVLVAGFLVVALFIVALLRG